MRQHGFECRHGCAHDPRGDGGYYCFPGAVAEGTNAFLKRKGSAFRARDCSGANEQALVRALSFGAPVMVWLTTDGAEPWTLPDEAWALEGGEELLVPYGNIHVLVLCGYDAEHFYLCDPLETLTFLPRAAFMQMYRQAGSRALLLEFSE